MRTIKTAAAALLTFATLGLAGAAQAQTAPPAAAVIDAALDIFATPQRLITLSDGRRMNLHCVGAEAGGPTVILEGGWTAITPSWRKVQVELAKTTRVCSYDRAGYGFSDAGPMPRTALALTQDLEALTKAAGLKAPYVLVAHSLGAFNARLFVDRNRDKVAGLVLVDPATEHQSRRFAAVSAATGKMEAEFEAGVKACSEAVVEGRMTADLPQRGFCIDRPSRSLPPAVNAARLATQQTAGYQRTALSELSNFSGVSTQQIEASRRSWGDLPLIVLTAELAQDNPDLPEAERVALKKTAWELHAPLADLSKRGEHRLVEGSSHFIPSQKPEAVVGAVTDVIAKARG